MNIYTINQQLQDFFLALPDTGELNQEALDQLEQLQLEKKEKQKNIILYKKNLDRGIEALDNEIKHLQQMKKSQQAKSDRLTNLLEYSMGDEKEINFDTCGAKFKKNPPKVVIDNEEQIPKKYFREVVTTKLDKSTLKADLKESEVIGAHLEQGERLDIY